MDDKVRQTKEAGANAQPQPVEDPLLECLLQLCKWFQRPRSSTVLTAGLPMVDNQLTPHLFTRAAQRAGLSARISAQPLENLTSLTVPTVLLLKGSRACVLIKMQGELFDILQLESGGIKSVTLDELQPQYAGSAIFVQPEFNFDKRSKIGVSKKQDGWLREVIFKAWPIYAEVLVASVLINLFALAMPLFIMNVYDRVVPNYAFETLWVLAIGVGIVLAFDLLMRGLRAYFIETAGRNADLSISATLFEKILQVRLESKPASVGAFANNLNEFESFRDFLTAATLTTLLDLPFLLVFIGIIALIGGHLAWIPLIAFILALAAGFAMQIPLKQAIEQLFRVSAQKGAALVETLIGLENIKTQGAEGQQQLRWEQITTENARWGMRSRFLSAGAIHTNVFFQQLAYTGVIVAGVYRIEEGDLSVGGLIACAILTGRALSPLAQVAGVMSRYHQAKASLNSLHGLINLPGERHTTSNFFHRPNLSGAIEFKNVGFSYPEQKIKAVDGISFRIEAGERVAIVGRLGSGKSTLEKLLLGLYQPQEGGILINGTDSRQIDPADLRRAFGYVPQDITLFYGSIRDNIALGTPHLDDGEILKAAQIAGVTEFVDRNQAGFDMPVGEGGSALSTGQRQTIAIARALAGSPQFYVMDEPTSAMDNTSENTFKKNLSRHIKGKTLILVTHRGSLLSLVDRLILLDNGKIVMDGPKQQVLDALNSGQMKAAEK